MFIDLSAVPVEEDCAMVGQEDYQKRGMRECRAFVGQLQRQFPIPEGARSKYVIRIHSHDLGRYLEVAIHVNPEDQVALDHAYTVEANIPTHWDDKARQELGLEVTV